MRIRKCAARLLGTLPACSPSPLPAAGLASSPPPQTLPWDSEAPSTTAEGLLCELNRSPWDDLMCLELIAPYDQEEEHEDGGIIGNGIKAEVGEARGIPGIRIKYDAAAVACVPNSEQTMNWSGDKVEEKARTKDTTKTRRKKKDEGGVVMEASASCKKSDGKGWHCKRRAQHPHSLCHYHLAQLRSYSSSSHGHAKVAESTRDGHGSGGGSRRKKIDAAGADSNFYYYYSGFGPWRGKTRGSISDNNHSSRLAADEEDEKEILESGNGHHVDNAVAAEDEDSDDSRGGRNDEDNNGRDGNGDDSREGTSKSRSYKKRGRKKMKARSLKSLL